MIIHTIVPKFFQPVFKKTVEDSAIRHMASYGLKGLKLYIVSRKVCACVLKLNLTKRMQIKLKPFYLSLYQPNDVSSRTICIISLYLNLFILCDLIRKVH